MHFQLKNSITSTMEHRTRHSSVIHQSVLKKGGTTGRGFSRQNSVQTNGWREDWFLDPLVESFVDGQVTHMENKTSELGPFRNGL